VEVAAGDDPSTWLVFVDADAHAFGHALRHRPGLAAGSPTKGCCSVTGFYERLYAGGDGSVTADGVR